MSHGPPSPDPSPARGEGSTAGGRFRGGTVRGCLLLAALATTASAQNRTYANPLDLDYRYNFEQQNEGISYRSGADPVVVVHRGEYYLFGTIADGYWRSPDLGRWEHVSPSRWPFEEVVAPAALSVRDTLYLFQSTFEQRPILFTTAPETGRLEFYNRILPPLPMTRPTGTQGPVPMGPIGKDSLPPGPWDPAIFHDPDTERWFMYWGSSNLYPLYGIELDKTRRLAYAGKPVELIRLRPERHGWERFGRDHRDSTVTPYLEGAWMTEHGGRYYLQYGAPGTEHNVYANGVYVGDAPLGPFAYAPYNPVSYRPGGWMTGAGHGSTFRDVHGNWWNTGTPWLGINWNFERRIALFPAGFHPDGQMYADTRFGDFPHWLPTRRWTRGGESFTGWMLLSYRRPVTASSARDSFPARHVTDEDRATFWVAEASRPGEWLTVDLGTEREVKAVQVNYVDHRSNLFATDSTVYTRFRLYASRDGARWDTVADLSRERRDRPNAYVELPRPVRARWIRWEHGYVAAANLAVGDLRVFGNGYGRPPATPRGLAARRDADPRNARISWRPVPGAVGYNVLWGIRPDRLHQAYQVWTDGPNPLELRALTVGQDYHFAVEAFDEDGVSPPSAAVHLP